MIFRAIPRESIESLIWGSLGILGFSLTLVATRAAVPELGSTVVGLGRALVAAVLAVFVLIIRRERFPNKQQWLSLAVVALGVIVGFPLFTSLALKEVSSVHGAVFVGFIPIFTAIVAVIRFKEKPSLKFWLACIVGLIAVASFAIIQGAGKPQLADLWLVLACIFIGIGYTEGGYLARSLGSLQVICWALILAFPFLLPPVVLSIARDGLEASGQAWLGFAYVSLVSMFLAYVAWYRALAIGSVARAGQIQLLQPLLNLLWGWLLLGETVAPLMLIAALILIASVVATRLFKVSVVTAKNN